jgi:predicted transposase/invertase (TIGR01784 family)
LYFCDEKIKAMPSTHIRFDWAIKRLLRQKANFGILEGFLSELLKIDVFIEEILEGESNQPEEKAKYNRVDILVKDSSGNFMLIEVQNEKEDDYFHRMMFGQGKLISERLHSGDMYGKLRKIYSINIVYFPLGSGSDYIYVSDGNFRGMHTGDILQLSEKQKELYKVDQVREIFTQYYILKVNNFDGIAKDSLDQWIYFLKNSEIQDHFKAKGLPEAKESLRVANLDATEKADYETFIKQERIRESEIITAFTDGELKAKKQYQEQLDKALANETEALAKAEKEKAEKEKERAEKEKERAEKEAALSKITNMVHNLNTKGISKEDIAQMAGLSEIEVDNILNNRK